MCIKIICSIAPYIPKFDDELIVRLTGKGREEEKEEEEP
jgi:hypothetical protein